MPPLGLQRLLTVTPLLLLIGNLASADAITGRVVDANGVGVAGVDIDLISLGGGGNPHEANDGTDANGYFTTTCDAGVYQVRFYAPPPPTTSLVTGIVSPVVVVGTKNMGTVVLQTGAVVSGTAKNAANLPVGNVKVNAYHATTGVQHHVKANLTNAFGSFALALPDNTPLRLEVLTNLVPVQVLVPREFEFTPIGNTSLGNITLHTGHHVTATVRTAAGIAVIGADVDVTDLANGKTLFTPSDNTNSFGIFDVVVPPGSYDLDVTRPAGMVLVSVDVNNLAVNAATNLGTLTMRDGVFLSGTVRDHRGQPVLAADVNVYEVSTGLSLALGSDNTNVAGFYTVVVPPVLIDVVFSPPGPHYVIHKDRHDSVNVTASMTLDGSLPSRGPTSYFPSAPPVPAIRLPLLPFSAGTQGSNGVPHIRGARATDGTVTLHFSGGRPHAQAELLLGRTEGLLARFGTHVVSPDHRLALRLDAKGEAHFQLPAPDANLSGLRVFAQLAVRDPQAELGLALSHVLALQLP